MLARFSGILTDLADHVPADIELLFHFCYGDANHKHVVEPTDMGDMVELANRLSRGHQAADRSSIHMPVPRDRSDDGYFAPLARAEAASRDRTVASASCTTPTASPARGARLKTAERHVQDFSIATECGFGRRDPATIPELLRIHAEVGSLSSATSGARPPPSTILCFA